MLQEHYLNVHCSRSIFRHAPGALCILDILWSMFAICSWSIVHSNMLLEHIWLRILLQIIHVPGAVVPGAAAPGAYSRATISQKHTEHVEVSTLSIRFSKYLTIIALLDKSQYVIVSHELLPYCIDFSIFRLILVLHHTVRWCSDFYWSSQKSL